MVTAAGGETLDETGPPAQAARAGGRPRWGLFVGLATAVLVLDQLVKEWIVGSFTVGHAVPVLGDAVRITVSHNMGALFGLFQGQAPVFAALSLAAIGVIAWYHGRSGDSLLASLALGLLLGGALGNFTDRLRLGYVVDFVDAGLGTTRWWTFNVADAAISAAILLLIVLALRPARAAAADG